MVQKKHSLRYCLSQTKQLGDYVVVIYEEQKFIQKMMSIMNGQAAVKCLLNKPLGVNTPQDFEKDDSVYYVIVYYISIFPKLVQVGRGWKWIY